MCKGPEVGRTQSQAWSCPKSSSLAPFWFLGEVTLLPWGPRSSACLCNWKEHMRSQVETPERHSSQGRTCHAFG